MVDPNNLTAWIAIGFGAYSVAPSIGGMIDPARWTKMLSELEHSPTLQFFAGVLTFFLGLLILLANPRGESWLSLTVTMIGWIELIEGLVIFIAPRPVFAIGRRLADWGRVTFVALGLGGISLIAAGWYDLYR